MKSLVPFSEFFNIYAAKFMEVGQCGSIPSIFTPDKLGMDMERQVPLFDLTFPGELFLFWPDFPMSKKK